MPKGTKRRKVSMPKDINASLLAPSTVRLFGRELITLDLVAGRAAQVSTDSRYKGESPLAGLLKQTNLHLAYILAFSYEGRYAPFHTPALFIVRTPGDPVVEAGKAIDPARLGLAHLDGTITFASDLKYWTYDRSDQTIRLDLASGTLQQLVIDSETGGAHGHRIDLVGQESSLSARLGQGNY
jgi:hypothetical protein